MATYWKSQPRKFCDVCKCWLSDNRASIEFHERGKSHKEKKERQITKLRKKSEQQYKTQQKAGKYLKQMEKAAVKKYKEDLKEQGIELIDSREKKDESKKPATVKNSRAQYSWVNSYPAPASIPTNSKMPPHPLIKEFPKPTIPICPWTEQISPEGHTYYWNTETGGSQWEKPENYIPFAKETQNPPGVGVNPEEKNAKEGIKETIFTQPDDSGIELKRARRRPDPYGGWSVVRPPKKNKKIDLQLPTKISNPVNEGLIDRTALEKGERPVIPKFKEKVVTSLGGDGGEGAVFKKKGNKQRSIRKRIGEERE